MYNFEGQLFYFSKFQLIKIFFSEYPEKICYLSEKNLASELDSWITYFFLLLLTHRVMFVEHNKKVLLVFAMQNIQEHHIIT